MAVGNMHMLSWLKTEHRMKGQRSQADWGSSSARRQCTLGGGQYVANVFCLVHQLDSFFSSDIAPEDDPVNKLTHCQISLKPIPVCKALICSQREPQAVLHVRSKSYTCQL